MTEARNEGTRADVTWTVDGIKHDRVEMFTTNPETGGAAVQCRYDCMCKTKKES